MTSISIEPFEKLIVSGRLTPKPYQADGVRWMLDREQDEKVGGGILADEMGLGKTIQIIGTLLCNFKRRTLIVVPLAILEQWHNTIYYFTGHRAVMFHGPNRIRDIANSAIVLTTYTLAQTQEIQDVVWDRIVFDEAHHLRNPKTKLNMSVRKLKRKITWLITGTPIQNKVKDIVTLFSVLGVDFGPSTRTNRIDIKLLCMEFLLKRTKKDADIHLPEIRFHEVPLEWSESQNEMELAASLHRELGLTSSSIKNKNKSFDNWIMGMRVKYGLCVLPFYTKCKQLCVMPSMMNVDDEAMDDSEMRDVFDSTQNADKLDMVAESVMKASSTIKKMVFCNFKKEMDYLKAKFVEQGREVEVIDGRASYGKRSDILANLPEILILQVYTCCEGLNLQAYKQVYFVSPQWNPSIEDQAVARCHRVGQTSDVDIFHFKMSDINKETRSLEHYICKVQEEKRKLYI